MSRRTFLGSLFAGAAAGVAACTTGPEISTETTSSLPETTTTSRPPSTTLPVVEPLDAPPVDLPDEVFSLGVASGDPDGESVMLWTKLLPADGQALSGAFQIVWEVAYDAGFEELAATGLTDVGDGFAYAVHSLAIGLQPMTRYFYRFRVGSQTSPVGRTRTLAPPDAAVDAVKMAVSSCQLYEDGYYAAHRDIAESDVDLVLWLGDFIYQRHGNDTVEGRAHQSPNPSSLASYRQRYEQYRSDPDLQAASAAHPWIMTTDDNDVAGDYDAFVDPERRSIAFQAWWEHQPTRLPAPGLTGFDVYRQVDIGDLCRIHLLDARQYADSETLLGEAQKSWLAESLDHESTWTVVASPLLVGGLVVPISDEPLLPYTFDGYPDERRWLTDQLANRPNRLVVSGDLHSAAALDVTADPTRAGQPSVAAEFMAPPISSRFPSDFAGLAPLLPLANGHIRRLDVKNGWLHLAIEPSKTTATFRFVSDVSDPRSSVDDGPRFEVQAGDPALVEVN